MSKGRQPNIPLKEGVLGSFLWPGWKICSWPGMFISGGKASLTIDPSLCTIRVPFESINPNSWSADILDDCCACDL